MHLPANISAENITLALQETDYDVINVTQTSAKLLTPEGVIIHTSFFLFRVTLAKNQKAPEALKLTALCNIVIRVDTYKSQNGLTQCYNYRLLGHFWMHSRQPPRCLW